MTTRYCILVLLAGLTGGLLRADNLSYTVGTDIGAGQTRYQFTLTNTGNTGGTLFDLFVEVPLEIANINTASIGAPAGWGDPTGGLLFFGADANPSTSFIEWTADFSGAHDLAAGSALAGSLLQPCSPSTDRSSLR